MPETRSFRLTRFTWNRPGPTIRIYRLPHLEDAPPDSEITPPLTVVTSVRAWGPADSPISPVALRHSGGLPVLKASLPGDREMSPRR